MKITQITTYHVKPRWMMVKVMTDEGVTGWGEPTLEGRATVVEEAIRVLADLIIGEDPRRIAHLYEIMYRGAFYRGGAVMYSAISGIEQALWDIKGKWLGVPVWELLGGKCRDRIRMYAHIAPGIDAPTREQLREGALKRKDAGFTALKTAMIAPFRHIETMGTVEKYVEAFAAIRECVGKDVDIAIDFHGRVSPAMAPILCRELESFFPMFIEEPVLPENVDAMKKVSRATSIPIATGERLFTTFGFREIIENQVASVLQPDICHCGGILQAYKIAAMGANYYASVAPHNPLGPIALAACIQLDACIPNFTAQEHPTMEEGFDRGVKLLKKPFEIENGYISVPDAPGLGITVNEDAVMEMAYDGRWSNPILYDPDDHSVAEW